MKNVILLNKSVEKILLKMLRYCFRRILPEFRLWKRSGLWHISGWMNFGKKNANLTVYFMDYSVVSVQWFSLSVSSPEGSLVSQA